ncbi:MAG: hypothetical protein IPJ19_18490 [Planctomycetes bacterium]|nr:hypothetical protein [Planctomycetota bacterium]
MNALRLFLRTSLLCIGLLGLPRAVQADVVVRFNLVNVTYGSGSGVLDGHFTYDFTTGHWVTCAFLNGQINGNPLVSPVTITPSLLTGDYSTQTWSYNYEVPMQTPWSATTAGVVFVDPPGTPPNQLTSFFVVDDGLGNPNSTITYPITGGMIVPVDSGTVFCLGDGTQAVACPCANSGLTGHGCDNSSATGGAQLSSIGAVSINYDSLQFTSSGEKPTATSVFLQGVTHTSGAVFGQGVLCLGGTLKRLYVHNAVGGVAVAPTGTDPSVHVRSAALGDPLASGTTRYYQVYYRDPSVLGSCSSTSTFNISQGLSEHWEY